MPNFTDTGSLDFMSKSTTLRVHGAARTFFDPTNPSHVESLKLFVETGSWGNVHFYPEMPYTDVPMTVMTKFVSHQLGAVRLTAGQKATKAAAQRAELALIAAKNLEIGEIPNVHATT